jgi:hypothetical protein
MDPVSLMKVFAALLAMHVCQDAQFERPDTHATLHVITCPYEAPAKASDDDDEEALPPGKKIPT